tara:strand:+ start:2928 stop:3191 length:264 start_codon:yes stop_codon:yes gene_type:complete
MLNTLRDCLNVINKEFELSLGREVILALWNKRHLRKFSSKELQGLYSTVIEELMYVKDKEVRKNLLKLKKKVIEVIIDEKFKTKGTK